MNVLPLPSIGGTIYYHAVLFWIDSGDNARVS